MVPPGRNVGFNCNNGSGHSVPSSRSPSTSSRMPLVRDLDEAAGATGVILDQVVANVREVHGPNLGQ